MNFLREMINQIDDRPIEVREVFTSFEGTYTVPDIISVLEKAKIEMINKGYFRNTLEIETFNHGEEARIVIYGIRMETAQEYERRIKKIMWNKLNQELS